MRLPPRTWRTPLAVFLLSLSSLHAPVEWASAQPSHDGDRPTRRQLMAVSPAERGFFVRVRNFLREIAADERLSQNLRGPATSIESSMERTRPFDRFAHRLGGLDRPIVSSPEKRTVGDWTIRQRRALFTQLDSPSLELVLTDRRRRRGGQRVRTLEIRYPRALGNAFGHDGNIESNVTGTNETRVTIFEGKTRRRVTVEGAGTYSGGPARIQGQFSDRLLDRVHHAGRTTESYPLGRDGKTRGERTTTRFRQRFMSRDVNASWPLPSLVEAPIEDRQTWTHRKKQSERPEETRHPRRKGRISAMARRMLEVNRVRFDWRGRRLRPARGPGSGVSRRSKRRR